MVSLSRYIGNIGRMQTNVLKQLRLVSYYQRLAHSIQHEQNILINCMFFSGLLQLLKLLHNCKGRFHYHADKCVIDWKIRQSLKIDIAV